MTTAAVPDRVRRRTEDDEYRPFPNEEGRNSRQQTLEVPALVRALRLPMRMRILEIGCGRGIALPPLARLLEPVRLTGLDIEPGLLMEARLRIDRAGIRAELVPGDARAMPFPAASFDLVIDFGTCYHIARPVDALREVARVLAPGGMFVHETPLSQLLSHPVRAFGRKIPWNSEPRFGRPRRAILWCARSLACRA
ncbi:MAG TPA: class I SAM-dependent methyltransferase [Gemmatimonadales bacterium]|nr:class I SAM-dependent methyltransferase [Gemmatimonadales bacterium]